MQGRHDRRGQLGQRCSDRHHRGCDQELGYAEVARQRYRRLNQQLRPDHESDEPGPDPGQLVQHVHLCARVEFDTADIGCSLRVALAPSQGEREPRERDERAKQGDAPKSADLPRCRQREHEDAGQGHERNFAAEDAPTRRDCGQQAGKAEDQTDVGDVAADDVTQGDIRAAGPRSHRTRHHLGGRGTESHDGHADHQRLHAHGQRYPCSAHDKPLRTEVQAEDTQSQKQKSHRSLVLEPDTRFCGTD